MQDPADHGDAGEPADGPVSGAGVSAGGPDRAVEASADAKVLPANLTELDGAPTIARDAGAPTPRAAAAGAPLRSRSADAVDVVGRDGAPNLRAASPTHSELTEDGEPIVASRSRSCRPGLYVKEVHFSLLDGSDAVGKGLFSADDLRAGTLVGLYAGRKYTVEEQNAVPPQVVIARHRRRGCIALACAWTD